MAAPIPEASTVASAIFEGIHDETETYLSHKIGAVLSPVVEALRSAVIAFPCPIKLLLIDFDLVRGNQSPARHFTCARLDLQRMGQQQSRVEIGNCVMSPRSNSKRCQFV